MIIDSDFSSLTEALVGSDTPREVQESLVLTSVEYRGFDRELHQGQLIIDASLEEEVQSIFTELLHAAFSINKVVPASKYAWDDERSMLDNNTSAFHYRTIIGTDRLSTHSLGRAIDINPRVNPYFAYDGKVYPSGATYEPHIRGTITGGSLPVTLFKKHGWIWLGERSEHQDYQHFEKPLT